MSWKKPSYSFKKNGVYASSSTSNVYITLTGTESENTTPTIGAVIFVPPNSGLLRSISFENSGAAGTTVLTLYDNTVGGVLGTKTFNFASADTVYEVDFTKGLDSGTNRFNGLGTIAIGFNPASASNTTRFVVNFEIDL